MTASHAPSQRWNLETILPGPADGEAVRTVFASVRFGFTEVARTIGALGAPSEATGEAWAAALLALERLDDEMLQAAVKVWCHFSEDVENAGAKQMLGQLSDLEALRGTIDVPLRDALAAATEDAFAALVARSDIAHMAFSLGELRAEAAVSMAPELEKLHVELARDGFHAWSRLYDEVSGALTVTIDRGKGPETISTEQAKQLLDSPDRALRQHVAAAITDAWRGQRNVIASALNHIAGYRRTLYGRRGVDELDLPLRRNRIARGSLEAMFDAIRAFRPTLARYLNAKARALGLEKLAWYDAGVSLGASGEKVSYEATQDFISEHFAAFSGEMGRFARHAFASAWIEVEDRPGKRQGGFCAGLPLTRESRIFMTFGGKPSAITTLAHELGHAYHNWVLRDLPARQREFPSTLAETASTFAETVVREAAYTAATDPAVRLGILDQKLEAAMAFCMNIPARFQLDRALYAARAEQDLDADKLGELTLAAFRDAYYESLSEYDEMFWASKLHFYLSGEPFYNFPYTVGYLFSLGLYAAAREAGAAAFAPRYDHALRLTGYHTCEEVAREALGVDLGQPDFWQSALDLIAADVAEFERVVASTT
jgi:oligoendopeptidase F